MTTRAGVTSPSSSSSSFESWLNYKRIYDRRSPYTLITKPNVVFNHEMRQVRWLRSPQAVASAERGWLIAAHVVFWPLMIGVAQTGISLALIGIVALGAIIGVGFMVDIFGVILSVGRIHRNTMTAEWDMLRLTGLDAEDILTAKVAAEQIRAWPLVILETLVRLLASEAMLLSALDPHYRSTSYFICGPIYSAASCVLIFLATLAVLEPIWRMRTITVLSALLGIQVPDVNNAIFYAVGLLLGLVIFRLPAIFLYLFVLFIIPQTGVRGQAMMLAVFLFVFAIPICYFVWWLPRFFYTRLSGWAWKQAKTILA